LLYDRYATVVYSVAFRVLGDSALAEQILSDIFLEIWRSPKRFMQSADGRSPSLAMIARHRAVEMLLHKPVSELDFPSPYTLANQQVRNTTREEACAAIDQLLMERRIMLERIFFHGMTQAEFAGHTRNPLETEEHLVMGAVVSKLAGTGLEVVDLQSDPAFARRQLHARDVVSHIDGMNRLARVFVENSTNILQELAGAAVDLCGADSAGISVELKDGTDDKFLALGRDRGPILRLCGCKAPALPQRLWLDPGARPPTDLSRYQAVLRPHGCSGSYRDGRHAAAMARRGDTRNYLDYGAWSD